MREVELGTLGAGAIFRWPASTDGTQYTVADFIVQGESFGAAGERWNVTLNTLTGATCTLPASTVVMATSVPAEPQEYDGRLRTFFATPQPLPAANEAALLAQARALDALADEVLAELDGLACDAFGLTFEQVFARPAPTDAETEGDGDPEPRRTWRDRKRKDFIGPLVIDDEGAEAEPEPGEWPWLREPTDAVRAAWAEARFSDLKRVRDEAADLLEEARDAFLAFLRGLPAYQEMKADDLGIINKLNAALRKLGR